MVVNMQIVSEASMRAPEEVFRREKRGLTVADTELGREDRSRARAQKKRVRRTHTAQTVRPFLNAHGFRV